MKQSILFLAIASLILSLSCRDTGTSSSDDRIPMRPLTSLEKALVTADNTFGFNLLASVNNGEPGKDVFISPVSVSVALGMTLNGAHAATRDSMARVLGFAGLLQSDINAGYRSLIDLLRGIDPKVKFQIANSIWYRPDLQVEQTFKDVNKQYFDALISSIDFSLTTAPGTINAWVEQNTAGKIKEIVPNPIPRDMVMYLINAIYFKGTWTYRFDPTQTKDDVFALVNGSLAPCRMMSMKATVPYFTDGQLQAVDLPYGDAGYSMTILLPAAGVNIDKFVGNLTQQEWNRVATGLAKREGDLFIPKFRLEYEKKLNDVLKGMGMSIAFSPSAADFTGIDRQGGLFISEARHKTYVEVDEEGTEAAGVTSIGIGRTSIGDTFVMKVNRPFVFVIRENNSGTILFIGKIVQPKS